MAPGQKGPLVVLGFGAGSSKRPLVKFGAGSSKRLLVKGPLMVLQARAWPLVKKGPWWFWGLGRNPPRGTWSKRAPGGFGVWGGVLQEAPGQKGSLLVLGFGGRSSKQKRAPGGFGV